MHCLGKGIRVIGELNVLGFIYGSRKVFGWLFGMAMVGSLVWYLVYTFHFKVIDELEKRVALVQVDLSKCKERAVKKFNTQNESVFDGYRERLKEIKDEKIVADEFNSSNYDWMYR